MPTHTIAERRKRRKRGTKTKEQLRVSATAHRRLERLQADDEFDLLMGGPTSHVRPEERRGENRRRRARQAARRRQQRGA